MPSFYIIGKQAGELQGWAGNVIIVDSGAAVNRNVEICGKMSNGPTQRAYPDTGRTRRDAPIRAIKVGNPTGYLSPKRDYSIPLAQKARKITTKQAASQIAEKGATTPFPSRQPACCA